MPWIPQSLPDYVERGGRQVWRPPYRADAAHVHGLVLPADPIAIDTLVQRDLVTPAGGALDYRCAHPNVIVTLAMIDRLTSATAPDSLRGYVPERELSVWCLLADMTANERLVWYLPYVFTDSGQTTATGREVYGYPKQVGGFDANYPDALAKGGSTTISGLAIDSFGPQACAVPRPMVEVNRLPGPGVAPPPKGQTFFEELVTGIFPGGLGVSVTLPSLKGAGKTTATITGTGALPPPPPGGTPPWLKPVIGALGGSGLTSDPGDLVTAMIANPTLAFLKQFRDVSCPTKACYQAVVEAPVSIEPLGATYETLDPALFQVTVQDWDSHPMASDLGLGSTQPLTPVHAFHAAFSFDVLTGTEVWRA